MAQVAGPRKPTESNKPKLHSIVKFGQPKGTSN